MDDFNHRPLDFLLANADDREIELRVRELRVIAALSLGWQSPVKLALDEALSDHAKAAAALQAIDDLPAIPRRKLLSNYSALAFVTVRSNGRQRSGDEGGGGREVCPLCGSGNG
jgi:hypothetical protein